MCVHALQCGDCSTFAAADEAVRLEPGMTKAHNRRGAALLGLLRWTEAEEAFQKALDLDPESEVARQGLASAAEHM